MCRCKHTFHIYVDDEDVNDYSINDYVGHNENRGAYFSRSKITHMMYVMINNKVTHNSHSISVSNWVWYEVSNASKFSLTSNEKEI